MDPDNAVVIAGEADESDIEEDEPSVSSENQAQPESKTKTQTTGEASESDDDVSASAITPLKVDVSSSGDHRDDDDSASQISNDSKQATWPGEPKPYKYDTLLHRKLRERNVNLQRQLDLLKTGVYGKACKDIQTITQQLIKSQAAIQDVTNNMRLMTNDLFHLEDRIDIVGSCNILPDINVEPSRKDETASGIA